ncbi:dynamin family protein [Paraburkholderia domus]|uniref:dynamin family protein n=1 Tax=Paraburkholderia domus TaxID=2793075 RepID=UPI001912E609|nr:dynamin family protein [Paraburkholderia domus]MBK5180400.1 dynamin family protein [Burkholderia sp. R-69749]CAE6791242.1 GTPase Era [Paraburkholderia domus]
MSTVSPKQAWTDFASELGEVLEAAGDGTRASLVRLIRQRLALPQAYVSVVGETSTGKSSLINALFNEEILPVSGKPTTGIVTHVACRNEEQPRFFAIYRDATQEAIDHERFRRLSVEPEDDILRLQVRATPTAQSHVGMHVFDTPGYNAILSKHEEVLMSFLPQSDVIVFVVGYRTGFGQVDQDLFEAVAAATAHDTDIPVILVINRTPGGTGPDDKRVSEIKRLARDGLGRNMSLHIIGSTNLPTSNGPMERRALAADPLWDEVHARAFDPAVLQTVQARLESALLAITDEADAALEREEAGFAANANELFAMQQAVELTQMAEAESLREVDRTIDHLQTALPHLIEKLVAASLQKIEADIESSSNWLGSADCAQWLTGHALPFEVRGIGRAIEAHLSVEMEALNKRLEEIANTTIAELDKCVALRVEDPVRRFVMSVSTTLGQRLAGNAVNGMLRGLGGVGGAAAGAGNLAKMALSRIGRLFGKQFGREVYAQIGRLFTKKMLERLNIAVMVIVELVSFVYEAKVWKGKLLGASIEAMQKWREDVLKDLHDEQLPRIRAANYEIIQALYGEFSDPLTPAPQRDARVAEVQGLRARIAALREGLNYSNA